MDRKQGLELVELFFDRIADRYGLQTIHAIPSLEGKSIDLLNESDPTERASGELFQLAKDPYGLKSIAYTIASNYRTAMIRHLHNELWDSVCNSYPLLFKKNADPDLISFTLESFKQTIVRLQYPADNKPDGEPFIPSREKLFDDYLVNIEGSRTHGPEAIKGIVWEVMSDLQEITRISKDLRTAALQAIAGDHAFDGKTEWDTVPNEQSNLVIEKMKSFYYQNMANLKIQIHKDVWEFSGLESFWTVKKDKKQLWLKEDPAILKSRKEYKSAFQTILDAPEALGYELPSFNEARKIFRDRTGAPLFTVKRKSYDVMKHRLENILKKHLIIGS